MVKHNVERPRLPAAGPKADRLAECISALSSPRPQESMPDGVLAQLPLEGKFVNVNLELYFRTMYCILHHYHFQLSNKY